MAEKLGFCNICEQPMEMSHPLKKSCSPECRKEHLRRERVKNKDKTKKYHQEYYKKNKKRVDRRNKAWAKANPYKKNKWIRENPERHAAAKKRWQLENAEYWAKQKSDWKKNNRDRIRLYAERRRGWMVNAGDLTLEKIQTTYETNIWVYGRLTCELCMKPIVFGEDSLEHFIPLARGGTNELENLGVAHGSCNSSKGKKNLEEWHEWLIKS